MAEIIRKQSEVKSGRSKKNAPIKSAPVVKKSVTKQIDIGENLSLEDIRKIILEIVQGELNRLKKKCTCPDKEDTGENEDSDDHMDIDLTRAEEIRDLATVDGKINDHPVSVVLDSASNKDLMPRIIANELGLKGNMDVSYIIRGATGEKKYSESVNATISLAPDCNIETNFIIADDYTVPEIILGRSTLKRYNYDLFESKDHASITCDGKNFFIPIVPDKNRQKKENRVLEETRSLVVEALSQ